MDSKGIDVRTAQVALDDLELERMERFVVGADVEQHGLEFDQLLHHPKQVGTGAAGWVDDRNLAQRVRNLARRWDIDVVGIVLVHECGDRVGRQSGVARIEVALERLAAHERHHLPRRVVGAGRLAARH